MAAERRREQERYLYRRLELDVSDDPNFLALFQLTIFEIFYISYGNNLTFT